MTLQEKLAADLTAAMKSGDKSRLSVLRMAKSALKYAEIDKGNPLDDVGVIEVLSREAKKRRDSVTEFTKAGRQEMADKEEFELGVIQEYLPEQMSQSDIEAVVKQVIEETGAQGPGDKGKLMGKLMPQLKGKADGQLINQIVTRMLDQA